jgi:hypothetical protein
VVNGASRGSAAMNASIFALPMADTSGASQALASESCVPAAVACWRNAWLAATRVSASDFSEA